MGPPYELSINRSDVLGAWHRRMRRQGRTRHADVVDTHHQNDGIHAGLAQDVTIEASQRVLARERRQDASARDSLVEHSNGWPFRVG